MRMIEIDSFVRVSVFLRDKLIHLDLICDSENSSLLSLSKLFQNIEDMEQFIIANTEEAFKMSIQKVEDSHYILNCENGKGELIISREKWEKLQGEKIKKFLSIIQKFMVDAITDNLFIIDNGRLEKQ